MRTPQGLPAAPGEEALVRKCEGKEDREFVNFFLSNFKDLARWMEEIAVFERGEFDHTFYDEMLLHNPRDQFQSWLEKAGLAATVSMGQLDAALEQRSFQQMRKKMTPGFIGSTGVGQWMHWLEEPVWRKLDALYLEHRGAAARYPALRHPFAEWQKRKPKPQSRTTPTSASSTPKRGTMLVPDPGRVDRIPLFGGGIGDVFLQCCTTDRYRILNEPDPPTIVVNASANEFSDEFFRWHPNAKRLKILRASAPPGMKAKDPEFYVSLGLPGTSVYEGRKIVDWDTQFFPSPKDRQVLPKLSGQRYGLFAPFSKERKTLPETIISHLLPRLNALLGGNIGIFGAGRKYLRTNRREQDFTPYAAMGWLTDLSICACYFFPKRRQPPPARCQRWLSSLPAGICHRPVPGVSVWRCSASL